MRQLDLQTKFSSVSDSGSFTGLASVFGNVDQGGDVVMPGAFRHSLKAIDRGVKAPVVMLWQHDPKQPIGVWTELRETSEGLEAKGRLALDTQKGREAHALLKQGALDGLSIGFRTEDSDFDHDGNRRLKALDLWEISIVTFPMNARARVGDVKGIQEFEHKLRQTLGLSSREAKHIANRGYGTLSFMDEKALTKQIDQLTEQIRGI